MAQPFGFTVGQVQHLFGSGCERRLPGRRCGAAADDLLDLRPDFGRAHAQAGQDLGRGPVVDAEQAEQQVLGADVVVAKSRRLGLGQAHRPVGAVGEMRELACPGRDREWFAFPAAGQPFHDPSLLGLLRVQPGGDPGGDGRLGERPAGDAGDQVTGRGGGLQIKAETLPS